MYANQQLLKSVKYAASAFAIGALVFGVYIYMNRPVSASAPAYTAPAPLPGPPTV